MKSADREEDQRQYFQVDRHADVALVVLDRVERLNAWHATMRAQVIRALAELGDDDDIKAIVITGRGKQAFSAGQDLNESRQFKPEDADWWVEEWRRLYSSVRDLNKPVVAALRGVAAGSAFQFSLLADVRVSHAEARIGQPEIRSGLPSPLGYWLMERNLGASRATELILTGRLVTGDEAASLGLVHHLVDIEEVVDKAIDVAKELAALPPVAMTLNKQMLRESSHRGFMQALEEAHRWHSLAYESGEPQACMEQFLVQRAARSRELSANKLDKA